MLLRTGCGRRHWCREWRCCVIPQPPCTLSLLRTHAPQPNPFPPLPPSPVQLHPCFASSLRMAQNQGLEELVGRAQELPLPPPPPVLPPSLAGAAVVEPPAVTEGDAAPAHLESAAHVAAAEAAAPQTEGQRAAEAAPVAEGCSGSGDADRAVGAGLQDSLASLLARADIAAALRGGSQPPLALLPANGGQQVQHDRLDQGQQQRSIPVSRAGRPPAAAAAEPSGSSLAPASSLDTTSSLRESQRKAAVEQVVQQIESNCHRRAPHRLSRKQRLKRRRQRLQQQADAAVGATAAGPPASSTFEPAGAMASGSALRGSLSPRSGRVCNGGGEEGVPSSPASAPAASLPSHWQHAMTELDAAFQPRLHLQKRLRLVVGTVG